MTTAWRERGKGAVSVGLMLGAGLIVLLLGPSLDQNQRDGSLAVGVALTLGALVLGGIMLWVSARHRVVYRLAQRYACPRCGLAPPPAELTNLQAAPCPRCGQSIITPHPAGGKLRGRRGKPGPASPNRSDAQRPSSGRPEAPRSVPSRGEELPMATPDKPTLAAGRG